MRIVTPLILSLLVAGPALPLSAKPKPKPKASAQTATLQAQIKKLTAERDELKDRLASTEDLQSQLAAAQKSRDLAREEAETSRKSLDQIKASLSENQNGGEAILQDLQQTKSDLETCRTELAAAKKELNAANAKAVGQVAEGALVAITPEITPARPMNLNRVTPKAKKIDRGVVVVNVLISETGEVLDTKLLQGLPGDGEWVQKANDACVEAAKRVVFDPARAADGKTRVRVWQGVGFYLD